MCKDSLSIHPEDPTSTYCALRTVETACRISAIFAYPLAEPVFLDTEAIKRKLASWIGDTLRRSSRESRFCYGLFRLCSIGSKRECENKGFPHHLFRLFLARLDLRPPCALSSGNPFPTGCTHLPHTLATTALQYEQYSPCFLKLFDLTRDVANHVLIVHLACPLRPGKYTDSGGVASMPVSRCTSPFLFSLRLAPMPSF